MFTDKQIEALQAPLDPKYVKPPPQGKYGEYIEGWHAIAEANRIFGHDGWGYNIDKLALTNATKDGDKHRVGYFAQVTVWAGGQQRGDVGHGQGFGKSEGDAHDSAVKEAVTDALKRALRSFGNPFGLALYDKTKANVGVPTITEAQREEMMQMLSSTGLPAARVLEVAKITDLRQLPAEKFEGAMKWIAEQATQKENQNA